MTPIEFISTNNQWEQRFGYARLARAGDLVLIGGTLAITPQGQPHAPGDAGAQTTRCYEIIEAVLKQARLDRFAIMRSRVFTTDITQAEQVGRAHHDFFAAHNPKHTPALTQVGTSELMSPEYIVEIECEAWAGASNTH
jgi:enamine deaminase RidA (YjgF/YER057c/UK114 family)